MELGATGVTVEVPKEARATLCGLCGDYNGATSNDLRGPDGKVTSDVRALAEAWRAPDFTQVGDTRGTLGQGGWGDLGVLGVALGETVPKKGEKLPKKEEKNPPKGERRSRRWKRDQKVGKEFPKREKITPKGWERKPKRDERVKTAERTQKCR